jgi:hypothetical protein
MATNINVGFVAEAADAGGVSVKALLGTAGVSDGLAARVAAADADGSGVLSLAELVSLFRSEENAVKEKRTIRRCSVSRNTPVGLPSRRLLLQPRPPMPAGSPSRPRCCAPPRRASPTPWWL